MARDAGTMAMLVQLAQQKADTVAAIEGWSADRLAYRPAPGAWSAAEVLDHVAKVERGVLGVARRGVEKPHRIGIRDRLGFIVLERVFLSKRRVKVPATASRILPDSDPPLSAILERWGDTRAELTQFVEELPPAQWRGGVFRHPVSGWMDMSQVLRFLSVHLLHHGFQLARLRASSDGP